MKHSRILTVLAVLLAAAILVLPAAAIDISGEGVNVSATGAPVVGSDKDEHGCIGSAGYTWCEAKQKCLREWEEPCVEAASTAEVASGAAAVPTTKSPLPAAVVIGALGAACVLAAVRKD